MPTKQSPLVQPPEGGDVGGPEGGGGGETAQTSPTSTSFIVHPDAVGWHELLYFLIIAWHTPATTVQGAIAVC
jgi:hypothetical protein